MVKHFSVDWMAQSSTSPEKQHQEADHTVSPLRGHVRCMVQPRQPSSYGKDYLQPKPPKSLKPVGRMDSSEDISLASPARSISCDSPISEISGYSSGYESEAALSECPSVDETSDGDQRDGFLQRRLRTKFTPEQINKLEKIFGKRKYLDAGERLKTAQKLNLSETQIRTWFQNRRMKLKREVQDMRAEYFAPALSTIVFPSAAIQYHDFAGQRFHQYGPHHAGSAAGLYPTAMDPQLHAMMQSQSCMVPHQAPYLLANNPRFH
ncbi:hypothetical protein NHX12_022318 [Muraenolepis orangiensis]|uniref:Homeobox domain-containing protein n=1 Tax=Muraenolepis orangiensis TaxID=630683 RepID=A0A9Q0ITF1_9TELE|nr:hypothetical protein NHX12_022318 [Muraenolepis orangiensis]